jgi:hypothetical protein
MNTNIPLVGIVMGSDSDLKMMQDAADILINKFGIFLSAYSSILPIVLLFEWLNTPKKQKAGD